MFMKVAMSATEKVPQKYSSGSKLCGKPGIVFQDHVFGLACSALLFGTLRGIGARRFAAEHESANRHQENFIGFQFEKAASGAGLRIARKKRGAGIFVFEIFGNQG